MVQQDSRVKQGPQDLTGLQARRVQEVSTGRQDQLVLPELLEDQDHQDPKVLEDRQESLALEEQ